MIPNDAVMSCVGPLSPGLPPSFQWSMGVSGLEAGQYALSVFVRNPPASIPDRRSSGTFIVRSFLDSGRGFIADMAAASPPTGAAKQMPYAELVVAYIDERAGIFNGRPSMETWVVFAFELLEAVQLDFVIKLHGPIGFKFSQTCEVHIGDGVVFSPLGDASTVQPPHVTQYILFSPGMNASCIGHENVALITFSLADTGGQLLLPAVAGKMYLFRMRVTNPPTTPLINDWLLVVAGQEYSGIQSYELWEFRKASVTPSNMAAAKDNIATIRFWNRQVIRGLRLSGNHGVLRVEMPAGFELIVAGVACLDFNGLFNLSSSSKHTMPDIVCEGLTNPSQRNLILLRNLAETSPLASAQYEFSCRIRNSAFPLEAQSWRFASYSLNMARDEDLLDISVVDGFPVNSELSSFSLAPWPGGQQSYGARATLLFSLMLT